MQAPSPAELLGIAVTALVLIGVCQVSKFGLMLHDRRMARLKEHKRRAQDETERTQLLLDRLDAERAHSEAEAAKAHKKT